MRGQPRSSKPVRTAMIFLTFTGTLILVLCFLGLSKHEHVYRSDERFLPNRQGDKLAWSTSPLSEQCPALPKDQRRDCGFVGISEQECRQRRCCWAPERNADGLPSNVSLTSDTPWCFFSPLAPPQTCSIGEVDREECGWKGITQSECEERRCCWRPIDEGDDKDTPWARKHAIPWCFRRRPHCSGYQVVHRDHRVNGFTLRLQKIGKDCALHGPDIRELEVHVSYETSHRVHIIITDANEERYEVPQESLSRVDPRRDTASGIDARNADYLVNYTTYPFTLSVRRRSNGHILFDTNVTDHIAGTDSETVMAPLVFEDKYLQVSTYLDPDAHVYGIGEMAGSPFRRTRNGTRQALWSRDAALPFGQNVYGSHPFWMAVRNGEAHGVMLLNSNGMDIILKEKSVTYKTLGGILDFYVYAGPSPSDVVRQHTQLIGRPHMVPLWALGWHQSRYGYKNVDALHTVIKEYHKHKIPLEAIWVDIDYMQDHKDFTFDPENFPQERMAELADTLHARQQKLVMILDPGIKIEAGYGPYDSGLKRQVFLRTGDDTGYVVGKSWPGHVHFPDWFHPNTYDWWRLHLQQLINQVPVDGIWIDMNEVTNWCDGNCLIDSENATQASSKAGDAGSSPFYALDWLKRRSIIPEVTTPNTSTLLYTPYQINNGGRDLPITTDSAPIDAIHGNGLREYDVHNIYGHMQSITTRRALLDIRPHLRPFVLTRSSFPGTGAYAAHWTGDNWSNWEHLADSISSIFNFQLFGIPLVGADICGFLGNATEELCVRWHQLGAFYPFARNHNAIGQSDQEPYKWPAVADALRTALDIRLALLSYMYTLFYDAHARGDTVWRPLFFEFPMDEGAYHFDHQIMIGDTIMITPVLEPGQDMLEVYFPGAVWFDWYTSMPILIGPKAHREDDSRLRRDSIGDTVTVYAPLDRIPIFIRGGRAIALHTSQSTTAATHSTPFTLLVALDEQGLAHGKLYLDDGVSQHLHDGWSDILFEMDIYARQLNVSGYFGYASAKPIHQLKILTASSSLMRTMVSTNQVDMHRALSRLQLRVNGTSIETSSIQLNKAGTELTIDGLDLPLTAPFVIEW